MGIVVAHMSMSLDGFIAGPDVSIAHPMGVGGERLHEWLFAPDRDAADTQAASEMFAPGNRCGAHGQHHIHSR